MTTTTVETARMSLRDSVDVAKLRAQRMTFLAGVALHRRAVQCETARYRADSGGVPGIMELGDASSRTPPCQGIRVATGASRSPQPPRVDLDASPLIVELAKNRTCVRYWVHVR